MRKILATAAIAIATLGIIAPTISARPLGPNDRDQRQPAPVRFIPFPGSSFFRPGQNSPIITHLGNRLVQVGCSRYKVGPSPIWTSADRDSYRCWQQRLGFRGRDADGIPGKVTWDKLRVFVIQ